MISITESKEITSKTYEFTNEEIIQTYLNHYRYSHQSVRTRKHNLNYFFNTIYFGYSGHIFNIHKRILFGYFDYLNNLETIALNTKKMKWTILKSLLEFCMEYYDNFMVVIPRKTIQWSLNHKEPNSNRYIIAEKEDIEKLLNYFRNKNTFHGNSYYLIFRIFVETGMRKGELISIDFDKVNSKKRYIDTKGKTGRKIYYISEDLTKLLKHYIKYERDPFSKCKALFQSWTMKRYSNRAFNLILKRFLKELGIERNISCHTFRKSLNTHRKLMGCPLEDRKILLNHKTNDVNTESYVVLNYEEYLKLYDQWNPYKNLNF